MMRSRGAKLTDIVVLVIAAEDGVMEQTIESINHAKATKCPIIVAINKIDKCTPKQVDEVKRELLKHGLIAEELGGDVQVVPISALKKTNLEMLKEEIWTRAEVMELTGDPKGLVEGYVIESTQDLHRGKMATVIVNRGTLSRGDYLVSGKSWCKVKLMLDEKGASVSQAGLSQAVQVVGWREMPNAGDECLQVDSEHRAKEICEVREKIDELRRQRADSEVIDEKRRQHDQEYKMKVKERIKVKLMSNFRLAESTKEKLIGDMNKKMGVDLVR
jgi:translation initiation factor IF-2